MPATGIRFTMFIHDGLKGISESHVYAAETIEAARPFGINLFKLRMALCGPPCVPFRGRFSVLGARRRTRLLSSGELANIGPAPVQNLASAAGNLGPNTSDVPNTCVLVKIYGANDQGTQFFLAGIPDAIITLSPQGPIIEGVPLYLPAWQAYANELRTQAWGFVGRVTGGDGFTSKAVTGVTKRVGDGLLGFATAAAGAAFAVGQTVQARGFRAISQPYLIPQGQFKINDVSPDTPAVGSTTYYLRATANMDPAWISFFGSLETVDFVTRKITSVSAEQQTTRKRGNRFLSGPGRRTKREKVSL